ncbi:bifunctional [glutamine synthetase] adenylyltransferase/[glutamine synthetase]-adenylyl-L-tyrosine phosphorylase [Acetobacter sp. AN02]|uniref:bifunctional [glutamine synthetase] adenylyltransferase/[glutamine synthetase]-adenylyl-L-tyrosine phosphorylase n=1 Tax=Acetobacter sp. AN02 TaxID=2894186 RepID=UPI0024345516|nr:bifunctional [glutamine synthetase] adenylyltransferase/[glutamine synthetase]-adenylyl-L-tyrosine phosphorylase [Acetobacter sp. AN02]MDG6093893.1 bifunctional [glutamine synthetase] adenylyltransferase/[glutamine synthetase]-adenylyl-L-tyrosine phosphorylase [Acetobacter sp. AN02]
MSLPQTRFDSGGVPEGVTEAVPPPSRGLRGRGARQHVWPEADWPEAADPRMAAMLAEDVEALWAAHDLPPELPVLPAVRRMIACAGGNSPYLSDLIRGNPGFFATLVAGDPEQATRQTLEALAAVPPDSPRDVVMHRLRVAKQHVALACALAEAGHFRDLEFVTQTLSALAETALDVSVRHLLHTAHVTRRLTLSDPGHPARRSGYVVLAMGKLGARELNFSSDIDLVVLFDPDVHRHSDEIRTVFTRMTSDLVRLMEARDADGYVFRTDLRLRPDPSATPLAVSVHAAISYYEAFGQTWERAAMTKARPVAGDIPLGRRFLRAIHPFIWRKNLDFALIDDIHGMKRRIDHHRGTGGRDVARIADRDLTDPARALHWLRGQNVKLGGGGIREIEFIAQAMQLIWAGRHPALRDRTTLGALRVLVRSGHIPADEAEELARSYRLLREVEHRIQMRTDQQTHLLPETDEGLNALGIFLGYGREYDRAGAQIPGVSAEKAGADFALELLPHMRAVRRIFERHFTLPEEAGGDEAADVTAPDLDVRLTAAGFPEKDAVQAAEILRGWAGSAHLALRSERARDLLTTLIPELISTFARRRDPLSCLMRFDTLLTRQRAGVQVLSLLQRNPLLIGRIADIFEASPLLAAHLAESPSALEGLLQETMEDDTVPPAGRLRSLAERVRRLALEAQDTETLLHRLRPMVRAEEFRLSVARLEQRMDEDTAARERTALADAVITVLFRMVTREHRRRHGRLPGGGMAVVVLGKAGSREMMAGSDLDLMMIFDQPEGADGEPVLSDGGRALAPGQYYGRLAHSLVGALTAPDAEGPLYPVDMRLRPSGAAGPVAVSRSAFLRYHSGSAWTWERMALTRARVVSGPARFRAVLTRDLSAILDGPGHDPATGEAVLPARVLADAAAMRSRLARDLPPSGPWDIKRRDGGLMEVEFIAQTLQLVAAVPEVRATGTAGALVRLARAGFLSQEDAEALVAADEVWRGLQSLLRILCGQTPPENLGEALPPLTWDILLRDAGAASSEDLEHRLALLAEDVRARFVRLIGPVGGKSG